MDTFQQILGAVEIEVSPPFAAYDLLGYHGHSIMENCRGPSLLTDMEAPQPCKSQVWFLPCLLAV